MGVRVERLHPEVAAEVRRARADRGDRSPVDRRGRHVRGPHRHDLVGEDHARDEECRDAGCASGDALVGTAPQEADGDAHHDGQHSEAEHDPPVERDRTEEALQRVVEREAEHDRRQRGAQRAAVLEPGRQCGDREREGGARHEDDQRTEVRLEPPVRELEIQHGTGGRDEGDAERHGTASCVPSDREHPQQAHQSPRDPDHDRRVRRVLEEVVEADGSPLLQQDRDPERRERVEDERHEDREVVEGAVLAQRADDPDHDTEDDGEDGRGGHELDRGEHRSVQQVRHRLAAAPADTEVARHEVTEPLEVADDHGRVEIEELTPLGDELRLVGRGALFEILEGPDRGAHEEIHGERRHEQGSQPCKEASRDERKHWRAYLAETRDPG
ncbi:hypothetical protein D3C74_297840 [compost metagenome]